MSATPMKIHPLVAAAAGAVIVVSLVGTAALLDWLPGSHSDTDTSSVAHPAVTTSENASNAVADTAAKPAKTASESSTQRAAQASPPTHKAQSTIARAPAHGSTQTSAPAMAGMPPPMPPVSQATPVCAVCGKVLGARTVEAQAKPSGVGVVAGAVVGGLLGNQVGGGSGKTLATVAGAVGGGYAGNAIEKRTRKAVAYEVDVQMEDGTRRSFRYDAAPAWRPGDRVKLVDGTLAAR